MKIHPTLTEETIDELGRQGFHVTPSTRLHGEIKFAAPIFLIDCTVESNVDLGTRTSIAENTKVYSGVRIGAFCSIGNNCSIGTSQHPADWLSSHNAFFNGVLSTKPDGYLRFVHERPTTIGNDVWIGANVVVMTGVKIGDGAIVGAGSVVTRDVEPYAIVVGVPARRQRFRFPPNIVARLLRLQWWNLDPALLYDLPASDVVASLDELERRVGPRPDPGGSP